MGKKHKKESPTPSLQRGAWRSPAGGSRQIPLKPSRTPAEETVREEVSKIYVVAVERLVVFQAPVDSLRPPILNPNLELGEGAGSLPATPGKGWSIIVVIFTSVQKIL